MSNWQPGNTAPKDGTAILIRSPNWNDGEIFPAAWHPQEPEFPWWTFTPRSDSDQAGDQITKREEDPLLEWSYLD